MSMYKGMSVRVFNSVRMLQADLCTCTFVICDCTVLNNATPISILNPYLRLPVVSWAIRKGWPLTRRNLERLIRLFQYG